MSQEPKRRHSRQRKGKRRASIKFTAPASVLCSNCNAVVLPHIVCVTCGFYKGEQIVVKKGKTLSK